MRFLFLSVFFIAAFSCYIIAQPILPESFDNSAGDSLTIHGWVNHSGSIQYSTAVDVEFALPISFKLFQNHPNPFNPTTTIGFQIHKGGLVTLIVYDILGNEITTLIDENKEPGNYRVTYDASRLTSGIYVYQLKMKDFVQTKKLILIK